MISFTPFLRRADEEGHSAAAPEATYAANPGDSALSVLLEGIALHALPSSPQELAAFVETIADLSYEVQTSTSPERTVILAGAAVRSLADHNRAVRELFGSRQQELEEMRQVIDILAGFLTRAGLVNRETADMIGKILASSAIATRGFTAPRNLELSALRTQLSECLSDSLDMAKHIVAPPAEDDPATGLPGSGAAMTALASCWGRRTEMCAAVFGVERMASINARFGFGAGDELLRKLSAYLSEALGPADRLFRWRGPHLLALMPRDIALGSPRMEVSRIAAWRSEHALNVRNREALVSVSLFWEIFPLGDFTGIGDLIPAIDEFLAGKPRAAAPAAG